MLSCSRGHVKVSVPDIKVETVRCLSVNHSEFDSYMYPIDSVDTIKLYINLTTVSFQLSGIL